MRIQGRRKFLQVDAPTGNRQNTDLKPLFKTERNRLALTELTINNFIDRILDFAFKNRQKEIFWQLTKYRPQPLLGNSTLGEHLAGNHLGHFLGDDEFPSIFRSVGRRNFTTGIIFSADSGVAICIGQLERHRNRNSKLFPRIDADPAVKNCRFNQFSRWQGLHKIRFESRDFRCGFAGIGRHGSQAFEAGGNARDTLRGKRSNNALGGNIFGFGRVVFHIFKVSAVKVVVIRTQLPADFV